MKDEHGLVAHEIPGDRISSRGKDEASGDPAQRQPEAAALGTCTALVWHVEESDLWDAGFVKEGSWEKGWWAVTEPDIYYNANLVLVAAEMVGS